MAKFDLEPGEQELGHWTIHYLPPTGGKYAGKLLVTDRRVLYEPLKAGFFPRQDFSAKGVVGTLTVRTLVGKNYWDGESLSIPRAEGRSVEKRRTKGMKQVAVTLADGQEFVFDNGLMSVDKLAALLGGVTAGDGAHASAGSEVGLGAERVLRPPATMATDARSVAVTGA